MTSTSIMCENNAGLGRENLMLPVLPTIWSIMNFIINFIFLQYELYQNWPNEDLTGNGDMLKLARWHDFGGGTGVGSGSIIGMCMYIFNE